MIELIELSNYWSWVALIAWAATLLAMLFSFLYVKRVYSVVISN